MSATTTAGIVHEHEVTLVIMGSFRELKFGSTALKSMSGRREPGTSQALGVTSHVHVDRPHPRLSSGGQLKARRSNHVLHPPGRVYERSERVLLQTPLRVFQCDCGAHMPHVAR